MRGILLSSACRTPAMGCNPGFLFIIKKIVLLTKTKDLSANHRYLSIIGGFDAG